MGVWLIVPAVIVVKYFLLAIFWGKKNISVYYTCKWILTSHFRAVNSGFGHAVSHETWCKPDSGIKW